MMVSLGVGGVAAGIMHLLFFLGTIVFAPARSFTDVIRRDIRKMGSLRRLMP